MSPPATKLEVDPKVYYQAATNCFDSAAALFDSFTYVFNELGGYGMMAGKDEDGRAWAKSYDQSAQDATAFFAQTYQTLRAYGTALNDIGFEHAKSDATIHGTTQPDRPADAASTATLGPYRLPASAAGGTPEGLAQTAIDVLDAINCPLPDGDTDTLAKAADAWDRLGRVYVNTNAKDKITIAASLFDGVTSADANQVREDLKTIETSIGELLSLCNQLSKACTDYIDSIKELREQVNGFINDIVADAALDLTFIVIASCLAPGPGTMLAGAKAAASAAKWSDRIKDAVKAWRLRKVKQLAGIADDVKNSAAKAWKAVKDLFDRLGSWVRGKVGPKKPWQTGSRPSEIPAGWTSTPARGDGTVWQKPGSTGDADTIRIMAPTQRYPNGYVKFTNSHQQPVKLDGKPGSKAETHFELEPDGSFKLPTGW
ncbi:hypothetical protein [Nocardia sp. NPDC058705]|uniref:WXG100-like domain-containing protein n=1 Tax=Nocardia sp. NPDC058705 TaxID=3346609 RepID=UPI0036B8C554